MEKMSLNHHIIFIFIFFNLSFYGQNEIIQVDSSGIIIIKDKKGYDLDQKNWTCIINKETQNLELKKTTKINQQFLSFFFPYDFNLNEYETGEMDLIIKKEEKIIFNKKVYFNLKPKGKYQLYNFSSNLDRKEIRGKIIDAYFFESVKNKHVIVRSISQEKRIYFYYLIDEEIINIHTDLVDYNSFNSISNPIIITDLNNDLIPEITCKYQNNNQQKLVFFKEKEKFICRKENKKTNHSEALNFLENIFYKQYLLNETINSQ
tara:strand:+ start:247 stop:1032 length:786 start_codon:yes stop_codon:yes gene_type:complete